MSNIAELIKTLGDRGNDLRLLRTKTGAPITECADALKRAGGNLEAATELLRTAIPQPASGERPVVFISYSHKDRSDARCMDDVLKKANAQPFFDQREIDAGEVLPDRLIRAIRQCDVFLLLWSGNAKWSTWVKRELDVALLAHKKVIPCLLDGTPLPSTLEGVVYIAKEDQSRGHVDLFRALFGKNYAPADRAQMFPGRWRIQVDGPEKIASAAYHVELFRDGSVSGSCRTLDAGQFGQLLQVLSAFGGEQYAQILKGPFPCHGTWSYDDRTLKFTIDLTFRVFEQVSSARIVVEIREQDRDSLRGFDMNGLAYTLQRQ